MPQNLSLGTPSTKRVRSRPQPAWRGVWLDRSPYQPRHHPLLEVKRQLGRLQLIPACPLTFTGRGPHDRVPRAARLVLPAQRREHLLALQIYEVGNQ